MNRVSLRKSQEKQGFSATMSGFWGPEGDWGIRRVAYVGTGEGVDQGSEITTLLCALHCGPRAYLQANCPLFKISGFKSLDEN